MSTQTMQAVEYDGYGGADVLTVRTVSRPVPPPGRVLVKVHGSSINPVDVKVRAGGMALMAGRRFPKRTGLDFAGEVVAVGRRVTAHAPGDRVWGFLGGVSGRAGTAAEYVAVKPSSLSTAPGSLDLVAAAALPSVGAAALLALRKLRLNAGSRLLVIGASGGVGSAAIQLACSAGARVTAVASASNEHFCLRLGATAVVDYEHVDHAALEEQFDAVLDCHGADVRRYRRSLVRGGRMVTTSPDAIGFALTSALRPGPRVRILMTRPQRAVLTELAAHVESGALRPQVDAIFSLDTLAEGHREVEAGHAQGKRVVRVQGPSVSDLP